MIRLEHPECPNPVALDGGNYKNQDNKQALFSSTYGKCMYCESKIIHTEYGDVEHIKPKSKYPQLEFSWDNLGIACTKCNRKYKNDNYDEDNPIVNPYDEEPLDYMIAIGALLFPKQGCERGEITINNLGLNRPALIEKRQEKINLIDKAIKACFRTSNNNLKANAIIELKREGDANNEFSMFIKAFIDNHQIVE